MNSPIDFSSFASFDPEEKPPSAAADVYSSVVTSTAGLWHQDLNIASDFGGALAKNAATDLAKTRIAVAQSIGLPHVDNLSVALLDWTTVRDSVLLVTSPSDIEDPFTALANMAAFIAAVIFYDHVIVLPDDAGAGKAYDLGTALRPLSYQTPGLRDLLSQHFNWATDEMSSASQSKPLWMKNLEQNWTSLLPDVVFPTHDYELGYKEEDAYDSPMTNQGFSKMFREQASAWVMGNNLDRVIRENDLKALYYEGLATTLRAMLGVDRQVEVRYVGGCLRSPLMLARADAARTALKQGTTTEAWLQAAWKKLHTEQVEAPFWLQAVVGAAHNVSEIPEIIAKFRKSAWQYRMRRKDFNDAVFRQDQTVLRDLVSALALDFKSLTENIAAPASASIDVAAATVSAALPIVPTGLVKAGKALAGTQAAWLRRLLAQAFRPKLSIVFNMANQAQKANSALAQAAAIFEFSGLDATEPRSYFQRLSQTTWIA